MFNLYPTESSEQATEKYCKKTKAKKMKVNKFKCNSKKCIPTRCLQRVVSRIHTKSNDSEALPFNQMIQPNSEKYRKGNPLLILLCTRLLYGTRYR